MERVVQYDKGAGLEIVRIINYGYGQHAEVLVEQARALSYHAEQLPEVRKLSHHPPLYELLLEAEEFDGFQYPEGYRIVFTLSGSTILVTAFEYVENLELWSNLDDRSILELVDKIKDPEG